MITLLVASALAQTPPVASQMHERYSLAVQARDHVIQGELEPAKALAKQLVEAAPLEDVPATWQPFITSMNEQAKALASADDVGAAGVAVAKLAGACGQCHGETDGGPGLEGMRGIPPQKWTEGDNMPLHLWSVDWMWLGLLAPSDEAWRRGADELDSEPLARRFGDDEKTAKQLEASVYRLAQTASTLGADAHTERAALIGELLGTCATCHVLRDAAAARSQEK